MRYDELLIGMGTLLDTINSRSTDGQAIYDGGHAFPGVAQQIRSGEINSLEGIRADYPPSI